MKNGERKAIQAKLERGFALPLVAGLVALLAIGLTVFLVKLNNSADVSSNMLKRRQAFYATDGTGRALLKLASDYMVGATTPTQAGMQSYIQANAGGATLSTIVPSPFTLENFAINSLGTSYSGSVPSGPYSGMNARQTDLSMTLKLRSPGLGDISSFSSQNVTLAQISMFQFFLFIDGMGEWGPINAADGWGRVHVNGDMCIYSTDPLRLSALTASGKILFGNNPQCPTSPGASRDKVYMPRLKNDTPFSYNASNTSKWGQLTANNDHSCTNCSGSIGSCNGLSWKEYALCVWNGNVLDSAHDVLPLKLPVSGSAKVNCGKDANNGKKTNHGNSRILVDPLLPSDSATVRNQKFAVKSDIRIIDGIWYVKDGSPWPGRPIWSDHPGSFSWAPSSAGMVGGAQNVGQDDIRSSESWATQPQRYSYYGISAGNLDFTMTKRPVISYGTLFRRASGPLWIPGHYDDRDPEHGLVDATDSTNCSPSGRYGNDVTNCVLNATRSGFQDPTARRWAGSAGANNSVKRSHVLPLNFDVEAFVRALNDSSNNELGHYFGTGGSLGRDFNGIVFITDTWSGWMNHLESGTACSPGIPAEPPYQTVGWAMHNNLHVGPDVHQEQMYDHLVGTYWKSKLAKKSGHFAQNGSLPYPLCNNAMSTTPLGSAVGGSGQFHVPSCLKNKARPSAVRIINGSNLMIPDAFSTPVVNGLTIVSNLPVYVLGDFNTTSDTTSQTSTPWISTLIGGDRLTSLSNRWEDENSYWFEPHRNKSNRPAINTTQNMSVLAGWVLSANGQWGGDIVNFLNNVENWSGSGRVHTVRGSLVIGFNSVYYNWQSGLIYNDVCGFSTQDWGFDQHLNVPSNQPPGAPVYTVQAIKKWGRN